MNTIDREKRKNELGIVFSGGGLQGIAHIGAVRALYELGMIDELREMYADMNQQTAIIHQQFSTPLFRPPHGWMRPLQYQVIRRKGYKIIMWDLGTRDYSKRLTAGEVLDNVKCYARNGSIITFHDSLRSIDKLEKILPSALEWLIAQGYEFRIFD